MPMSGGNYVAPTWVNNASPAISASELQAMSDTIEANQGDIASLQSDVVSLSTIAVSGTYTGNASSSSITSQTISLGFTPIAVFAVQKGTNFDEASVYDNYAALAVTGSPAIDRYNENSLVIKRNGFTVYGTNNTGLNESGMFYNYIALKKVNL